MLKMGEIITCLIKGLLSRFWGHLSLESPGHCRGPRSLWVATPLRLEYVITNQTSATEREKNHSQLTTGLTLDINWIWSQDCFNALWSTDQAIIYNLIRFFSSCKWFLEHSTIKMSRIYIIWCDSYANFIRFVCTYIRVNMLVPIQLAAHTHIKQVYSQHHYVLVETPSPRRAASVPLRRPT